MSIRRESTVGLEEMGVAEIRPVRAAVGRLQVRRGVRERHEQDDGYCRAGYQGK
jgi:hypothetical protein